MTEPPAGQHVPFEEVVRTARRRVEAVQGTPTDKGTERGHLEGLLHEGRTSLSRDLDQNAYHHAGFLAGSLTRWLHERGRPLDAEVVTSASIYGAMVSRDLVQRYLTDPVANAHKAHLAAMLEVERTRGEPLPAPDESHFVSWLVSSLPLRPDGDVSGFFARQRERRIAHLFPERDPD